MSSAYLYCQNHECGEYLGSLGGDSCHLCGWAAAPAASEPVLTSAQDAIEAADAHTNNAALPTYTELLEALQKLAGGASRPMLADSCGRPQCKVLAVNVDAARALLARHDRTMRGDFRG